MPGGDDSYRDRASEAAHLSAQIAAIRRYAAKNWNPETEYKRLAAFEETVLGNYYDRARRVPLHTRCISTGFSEADTRAMWSNPELERKRLLTFPLNAFLQSLSHGIETTSACDPPARKQLIADTAKDVIGAFKAAGFKAGGV